MNVRVFVLVEIRDAVDDALRLLRCSGVVQPDERASIDALAQNGEVAADGVDVEESGAEVEVGQGTGCLNCGRSRGNGRWIGRWEGCGLENRKEVEAGAGIEGRSHIGFCGQRVSESEGRDLLEAERWRLRGRDGHCRVRRRRNLRGGEGRQLRRGVSRARHFGEGYAARQLQSSG